MRHCTRPPVNFKFHDNLGRVGDKDIDAVGVPAAVLWMTLRDWQGHGHGHGQL